MKKFVQTPLAYDFGALEPAMERRTVELHYGKHHAAYVSNLNAALEKAPEFDAPECPGQLLAKLDEVPEAIRTAVRNNGGGYLNHELFWKLLTPKSEGAPVGELAKALDETFGSFEAFKEKFAAASMAHFGAGWTWLIMRPCGKLKIVTLPNQDNPLMPASVVPEAAQGQPVLALDLWEHAYYLQYQNLKAEYVKSFWQLANWTYAEERYQKALARTAKCACGK